MTSNLEVGDFAAFFAAVNVSASGRKPDPFPWQMDLVKRVARSGRWPSLLDLPTGAGKTAAIDVAVFMMALRDDAPRRVAFVVDRRVIVQQAATRARCLAHLLVDSDDQVVKVVADRLRARSAQLTSKPVPPLRWAELRGGMVRDESWALRPDVPAVLVSTVDQVGSRLLFRGYGISQGMRPVHAGLLGNDALFLLDEVHLAQPFAETLRAIAARYRPPAGFGLPDRWQIVELSATPDRSAAPGEVTPGRDVLSISERDRDPDEAPVLARRLAARKLAEKRLVRVRGNDASDQRAILAREAARSARAILATDQGRVVGVVVNRVDTARQVHAALSDDADLDCVLLTGRMRPFDRDDVITDIRDRLRTGRERLASDPPLVVVATQSIEAGADFDFDALVTECASFDALKQRFGRVDRDGVLSAADVPSHSVILACSADVAANADDPIYRTALRNTWNWLPEGRFDFTEREPAPDEARLLLAAKPVAPFLLASHLDRWVQTAPYPDADPDAGLWLHGLDREPSADVNVVWRADLAEELLIGQKSSQEVPEADRLELAISLVTACRPGSGEAMPVPVAAVRAWLGRLVDSQSASDNAPVADVEGISGNRQDWAARGSTRIKPVLRWRGDDSVIAAGANDIKPGDTLIVPVAYGGMTAGNWAPDSRSPVSDLGHRVQAEQRHRAVLRLNGSVLRDAADWLPELPLPFLVDAEGATDEGAVAAWLNTAAQAAESEELTRRLVTALQQESKLVVTRVQAKPFAEQPDAFFVVSSPIANFQYRGGDADADVETADTEPETSSFSGSEIHLDAHLSDVANCAGAIARACGLDPGLAADLALAARLHDVGKADPRFQAWLQPGRLAGAALLAKSKVRASKRVERERDRREAGYPKGNRHELLSVAMVQHDAGLAASAGDWDLVLHLVASHHGFCRPFAPAVRDPSPVFVEASLNGRKLAHSSATELARIDSGVADRFWILVERYGWFGLAWLEAVLRLADHRASAIEQGKGSITCAEAEHG